MIKCPKCSYQYLEEKDLDDLFDKDPDNYHDITLENFPFFKGTLYSREVSEYERKGPIAQSVGCPECGTIFLKLEN